MLCVNVEQTPTAEATAVFDRAREEGRVPIAPSPPYDHRSDSPSPFPLPRRSRRPKPCAGGLAILLDNRKEHLEVWQSHSGRAVVMAPHGQQGYEAARHAIRQHGIHVIEGSRRGHATADCAASSSSSSHPAGRVDMVSMQWLRECLHRSKYVSPSRHPVFRPYAFDETPFAQQRRGRRDRQSRK